MLVVRVSLLAGSRVSLSIAALWIAHIGFDRTLGYGLKSSGASQRMRQQTQSGGLRSDMRSVRSIARTIDGRRA